MDWIKKNPHNVALAALSLILLAASALIIAQTQSFAEGFAAVQETPPRRDTVAALDTAALEAGTNSLAKPAIWAADGDAVGSLFVAERYYIEAGKPVKTVGGEKNIDSITKQRIPNAWFLQSGLNPLDPTVTQQDADSDGFSNQDEWRGKTDPRKKESHPPYHTKLYVKQYLRVPFLLRFDAYDGDPKKPEAMTFQINAVNRGRRTQFLQLGESLVDPATKTEFKLEKFEFKEMDNPGVGGVTEVSELTLLNKSTNETVTLVLGKTIDSPESNGIFSYTWPQPPIDIAVKKLGSFVLRPNIGPKDQYKLIDIKDTEALIQLPSGEQHTVSRPPQ